jgi:hypothetical protein
MLPLTASLGPVHVTVAGIGGRRRRDGIIVRRSTTLTRHDVMLRDGIPGRSRPERSRT